MYFKDIIEDQHRKNTLENNLNLVSYGSSCDNLGYFLIKVQKIFV